MPFAQQTISTNANWRDLKAAFAALMLSTSLPTHAAEEFPVNFDDIRVFTDEGRLITLTNNHHLLPDSCVFKGRADAKQGTNDVSPIDAVTAMNWYIETSRKYQANYLLANANLESLWSYQCP